MKTIDEQIEAELHKLTKSQLLSVLAIAKRLYTEQELSFSSQHGDEFLEKSISPISQPGSMKI